MYVAYANNFLNLDAAAVTVLYILVGRLADRSNGFMYVYQHCECV